jgi:hypothetical protein
MKIFLSRIIIFSILSFQFSEWLIFLSFKINQETIAKTLCIEKDVQGSTCKGCCQLKKKLDEQKEQKKDMAPLPENKQDLIFFAESLALNLFTTETSNLLQINNVNNYVFSINQSVFHPPKLNV